MCGNVGARGGKPPFSQVMHGDREARAFDRYYLFRAYRLRQVQQRLMGRIGYRSVEKYLTSSEMSDIVGMELEGTPMVFRKRTPRQRGQLRFCIKTHFKRTTGAQKAPLAYCLRISGDIKPPGTFVPGGLPLGRSGLDCAGGDAFDVQSGAEGEHNQQRNRGHDEACDHRAVVRGARG